MLRAYAGPELFAVLKSATTFEEALEILDKQFEKPTRILFARYQALARRQYTGPSLPSGCWLLSLGLAGCLSPLLEATSSA